MKLYQNAMGLLMLGVGLIGLPASAKQSPNFEQGTEYQIIAPKESEKPIIEEFFNYACGACFSMEKLASEIQNENPGVEFKLIPVELNPSWKIYVKAYYIGEKLAVLDKSHMALFRRIHVDKKPIRNDDDLKDFYVSLGVDAAEYDKVAKSFWLNTQIRMSKQYAMKSKVIGTPTFVINKRYKLENKELGSGDRIKQAIREFSQIDTAPAEQATEQ
ncbi:thiol:disulfide interchange protein DsbA/DsbL [Aliikangiella maris]|uniref:Thiol:disulfide interchange protein DsbA/DsbL n=2 Tax=Aliikangiella maris TaxID=3162458 RepID=A0ABV2BX08_9GAMM